MDHVVQQNAANAEQSAAAAEELSSQAQTLQEIVKELKALVEGVKGSRGESDKRPELAQGEERSFNSHDTEKQAAESLHGGNGRRRPTISEVKRSLPQVTGKA
jgi:methyl-accepting chemotaxis protein